MSVTPFAPTAFWTIFATVWDLPEPVEPTTAICLLKNLFPSTGTSTSLFVASVEKQKRSFTDNELP